MVDPKGEKKKLAVLLTCHNRKEKTLLCLRSLKNQLKSDVVMTVYLVDDGSTDGTSEEVTRQFCDVRLLHGDGSLFWNGGMRKAFSEAINKGYDYYLWVNDDVELLDGGLEKLLNIGNKIPESIIVGSTQDFKREKHTYGGMLLGKGFFTLKFSSVEPHDNNVLPCDTFNGNCVLIPAVVVNEIGNLSLNYTHGMGDFDYGLRAKQAGYKSVIAPGYYGLCDHNPTPGCFSKTNSILKRLKNLHSPKGLPPREWLRFAIKHAPYTWPLYIFMLYYRVLFPR